MIYASPRQALLSAALLCSFASAQCAPQWVSGGCIPGVTAGPSVGAYVYAITPWDPDGAGPANPVYVLGGSFTLAGTAFANNIATYDPISQQWGSLGSGTNDVVRSLAVLPNGDLVAGGLFSSAGGQPADRIARWNGTSWSALGAGIGGTSVLAMTTMPSGDLVVGGIFSSAGGVPVNHIARWDGVAWSALDAGVTGSFVTVMSLLSLPNGDLLAGGAFTTAGSVPARSIARWDGTAWSALGAGCAGGVEAMARLPNGDVVAGGSFATAGGVAALNIARWDGTTWSPLGAGIGPAGGPIEVHSLRVLPNGNLIAGGYFTQAGTVSAASVARWDGTTWSAVGGGAGPDVYAIGELPNGSLLIGGRILVAGGPTATAWGVATWNGTVWAPLGPGTIGTGVNALTRFANGDVAAGGSFTSLDGVLARSVARWNGTTWSPLGSGVQGGTSTVSSLAALANGHLIVGGGFTTAGGIAASNIARWDGAVWSPLGAGMSGSVTALAVMPNGDVVAGGSFLTPAGNIARWNGTTWSSLGNGINNTVKALLVLPNGQLVAGGAFTNAGGVPANRIARWNGASWSALGSGVNADVSALGLMPNGNLVAGGTFTSAGGSPALGIAQWNGASWSQVGSGLGGIAALGLLPNGDLVAGGAFGAPAGNIARWNGTTWSSFGAGSNDAVRALVALPAGGITLGGVFTVAGGLGSALLARLVPTCPATAIPFGASCNSTVGPMVLTANTLPWIGGTFRATCTGIAANSLCFGLLGFTSPGTPLALLHPAGAVGCSLLANPDASLLILPTGGTVTSQFGMPVDPVFAGLVLQSQVLQVEVDPSLNITRIGGSNGLSVTLGAF